MNVLFVFGSYPYPGSKIRDGGADYLKNLAETLASRAHKIGVLTSADPALGSQTPVSLNNVNVFPIVSDWGLLSLWRNLTAMREFLKELDCDVINVIYPDTNLKSRYLLPLFVKCFAPQTPVIATLFHFFPRGARLSYMGATLFFYMSCARLHFHDEQMQSTFGRIFPLLKRRTVFVPVGCNIQRYAGIMDLQSDKAALKKQLGLNPAATYICFFGYWYPSKGVDLLIRAIKKLKQEGDKVHLLLIGGPSLKKMNAYEKRIVRLIHDLHIEDRVVVTGYCAEPQRLVQYMLCAEASAFPFRNNMTGRSSIMASIAMGLPMIVTRLSQGCSFLRHKETAYFTQPENCDSLADAMKTVLNDKELRVEMSSNLLHLAQRIAWDNLASEWEGIYHQVAAKRAFRASSRL